MHICAIVVQTAALSIYFCTGDLRLYTLMTDRHTLTLHCENTKLTKYFSTSIVHNCIFMQCSNFILWGIFVYMAEMYFWVLLYLVLVHALDIQRHANAELHFLLITFFSFKFIHFLSNPFIFPLHFGQGCKGYLNNIFFCLTRDHLLVFVAISPPPKIYPCSLQYCCVQ